MNKNKRKVGLTELVLRDGQQSLIATRMRLDDMLEVAKKMDQVGYWSVEMWGGATYDSCLRYLNEDPWHRLRELKKIFKKTKLQMLMRGKNLVGYKPYSDEIVKAFVEKASKNGIDVFRTFDALNDFSNIELTIKEVKKNGKHAQGAMAYTVSPVHTLNSWLDLAKQIEDAGADSVAIKDMAGLLKPNAAFELVSELKHEIGYLISKGGITTNLILSKGLNADYVYLEGQILTGISVVTHNLKNGEKLPIVTHPGNIGTKDSLVNIWKVFENKNNF